MEWNKIVGGTIYLLAFFILGSMFIDTLSEQARRRWGWSAEGWVKFFSIIYVIAFGLFGMMSLVPAPELGKPITSVVCDKESKVCLD